MTCCWHNCPDRAVMAFRDVCGGVRGLCRFHAPQAVRWAEALGMPIVTEPLKPEHREGDDDRRRT